jgi:hypothetical protein
VQVCEQVFKVRTAQFVSEVVLSDYKSVFGTFGFSNRDKPLSVRALSLSYWGKRSSSGSSRPRCVHHSLGSKDKGEEAGSIVPREHISRSPIGTLGDIGREERKGDLRGSKMGSHRLKLTDRWARVGVDGEAQGALREQR